MCILTEEKRKKDKKSFLTLHGNYSFIVVLIHLLDRKSLLDNDAGVYNA